VLPASERLDLRKVREIVGAASKSVHLAAEHDLERDYAEFELGAVAPIGGRDDPVLLDSRLSQLDQLVFEAGSHEESIRVRGEDFRHLANPQVADLCAD